MTSADSTASPTRPSTAGGESSGTLEVSEARRLRQLEDENHKLKQLVADLTLDKQALKVMLDSTF